MASFAIMRAMVKTEKTAGWLRRSGYVVACAGFLAAQPAESKVLEGYIDVYAGGMYGTEPKLSSIITKRSEPNGSGMSSGADFFNYNSGGLLGLRGGVEVLHTDVYVQFDQFVNLVGFSGASLQLMLGWDIEVGGARSPWKGVFGAYGGLLFGIPYRAEFPIDRKQIAWFGAGAEGQIGVEYYLSRFLVLHLTGTFGDHYLFAGAEPVEIDANGNTAQTRTHGFHLLGKLGLRFQLGI